MSLLYELGMRLKLRLRSVSPPHQARHSERQCHLNMSLLFAGVMLSGFAVWILVTAGSIYLMDLVPKGSTGLKLAIGLGGMVGGLASFIIWIGLGASYLRTKHITGAGFQGNCLIIDNVSPEFAEACVRK
jgi:hypothetical protein